MTGRPMSIIYVVMRKNFEYNDEVFSTVEGGTPIIGYRKKCDAEDEAEKRSIEELAGENIFDYGYNIEEIFLYNKKTEAENLMKEMGWDGTNEFIPGTNQSYSKMKKLLELLGFELYYVKAISLDPEKEESGQTAHTFD